MQSAPYFALNAIIDYYCRLVQKYRCRLNALGTTEELMSRKLAHIHQQLDRSTPTPASASDIVRDSGKYPIVCLML